MTATDYDPFGMQLDDRNLSSSTYRFGFNGKENDPEVAGQQDYGFRIYDRNLARFKSVDPLTKSYPELTTFQFASNSPIANIDLDGLESQKSIGEPAHGTVEARDQLSSYTFYDRNRFPIISIIGSDKLGSYATKGTQAENAAYLHDRNAMYVARGAEAIKDGGLVTAYFAYTGANVEQLEQVSALENALLATAAAAKTKTMSGQGAAPKLPGIKTPKTEQKIKFITIGAKQYLPNLESIRKAYESSGYRIVSSTEKGVTFEVPKADGTGTFYSRLQKGTRNEEYYGDRIINTVNNGDISNKDYVNPDGSRIVGAISPDERRRIGHIHLNKQ